MQLVIASQNLHKIRELREMLKPCQGLDVLSLLDFPSYKPLNQDYGSFEVNATQKAIHAAHHLNQWTLADDTGLVVPALQGEPGSISARFSGTHATDADHRKKLLGTMKNFHDQERQAYFECWLALASPEGLKKCARGVSEGILAEEEKGGKGFGYDSLFIKHEYGKTFAELEETIKNRISHRRKAFDKLYPYLASQVNSAPDKN